jgi:hypothetical protein
MMQYEQFIERCKALDLAIETNRGWTSRRGSEIKGHFLSIQWQTGGMTGGSCWGGESDQPLSSEPEPEFSDLDKVFEEFCPNINFLQYKRLCRELIKLTDGSQNEYYGNYYTYAEKWVDLQQVFDLLSREKGTTLWDS